MKEKLSIRSTDYFALALEEQYNISRLHLLHEEELIQQVGPGRLLYPPLPVPLSSSEDSHLAAGLVCFPASKAQHSPNLGLPENLI